MSRAALSTLESQGGWEQSGHVEMSVLQDRRVDGSQREANGEGLSVARTLSDLEGD